MLERDGLVGLGCGVLGRGARPRDALDARTDNWLSCIDGRLIAPYCEHVLEPGSRTITRTARLVAVLQPAPTHTDGSQSVDERKKTPLGAGVLWVEPCGAQTTGHS